MKKLLLGAIVLSLFAISLTLIQISCSKSNAQTTGTSSPINKIIYAQYGGTANGVYIANYDGSGVTRVNFTLPSGYTFSSTYHPVLSPDGAKVFLIALNSSTSTRSIFSCDASGANLVKIIDCNTSALEAQLGGAY